MPKFGKIYEVMEKVYQWPKRAIRLSAKHKDQTLEVVFEALGGQRSLFYLPAIVPVVASAILWIWVLNPENGLINAMLRALGFDSLPLWLSSPSWLLGSKAAIILISIFSRKPVYSLSLTAVP